MNQVILIGRAVKDTEAKGKTAITTLAVDRPFPFNKDKNGDNVTDFITLKHLGERNANRAEQYITKGVKIACRGVVCRDTYKKDDEYKEYTYVICQEWEFAESKGSKGTSKTDKSSNDDFMDVSGDDDGVPFE